ncbi:KpsF/GutQ family sugar-phosphate isomerase [Pseudopelagicola sp. nBUS_19]|uniref:KpsF/GutQ family sugar-phosphate isomerase n=1 Tax=Pseudopelagicola sp. nBUS_19 TaxID=3395316 RepID=UPI003EB97AE8
MTQDEISTIAARVISIEADALHQMARDLPADFSGAVEAILQTKGRVIVSGVGKSGHIGNKIAATLASTGTPASFVHATEASHGDLGMVTAADFCLLISNSGETSELSDIVAHTSRFSIPMAAISSKPHSTLMQAADYKLALTSAPEACSIGMVPTTSTTLTLALGDALAVVLMERRDFQPDDFKVFHPGGKLGAQMAKVAQLMHHGDALPIVDHQTPMQDVLITMTSKGFGIAVVIQDGTLWGVITDGDLRRHMDTLMHATAGDIAGQYPVTITPNMFAAEALNIMNTKKISVLLAVDETNMPIGILHIHDLLRAGVA